MTARVPILVVSCDRYRDVWRPFFTLFFRRWPDCPFPVHLGTNHEHYDDPRVTTLNIGDDLSWASGVLSMLDALGSEYVMVFLEDFFLTEAVDTRRVVQLVELAQSRRSGCMRFAAGPPLALPPTRPLQGHEGVGVIDPGEPWRVSAQIAVWRTDVLRRLLVPGLNAWQFEQLGTPLSERFPEEFLGLYEPAIHYLQGIEKGKWKSEGLAIFESIGEPVDLSARGFFTDEELGRHYAVHAAASSAYEPRLEAESLFLAGRRSAAVRAWKRYWRANRSSLRGYVVLLAGLLGPPALRFARARWVDLRLAAVRMSFFRKARRHSSRRLP